MIPGWTTFTNTTAALTLARGFTFGLGAGTDKVITGLEGWDKGAPMRRNKTERLNQHGTFAEPGKRDERTISVSGSYRAPNRAEAAAFVDLINAYLGAGELGLFEVTDPDLGNRRATVQLLTPDVTWGGGVDVAFTLDLSAPDPRKYGDPVTVNTGVPKDGGGLAFDMFASSDDAGGGILDFGEMGDTGTAAFNNAGSADAPVKFRVNGYAPGFTVTETATGRRLVYTGTVPAGQFLTLDPVTGQVLLNGDPNADRSEFLTVREWTRTPGGGRSEFLFESGGPNATLELEGVPAWW